MVTRDSEIAGIKAREQAGYSGTEEKSKEDFYSGLIPGKCRAGVSCQPWEEESRNAHWERGGGAEEAGAQRATGRQNKTASKILNRVTHAWTTSIWTTNPVWKPV